MNNTNPRITFFAVLVLGLNLAFVAAQQDAANAPARDARPRRPTPPARDPFSPGFVEAKELPDGTVPPADADGNFIIPQAGIIRSLNISVACAVSLYEAFRQKRNAGHYDKQKLSESEYQQLSKEWGLYGEEINL